MKKSDRNVLVGNFHQWCDTRHSLWVDAKNTSRTFGIFSRSTLAEFNGCPSALWIRYLNPHWDKLICIQASQSLWCDSRDITFREDWRVCLWAESITQSIKSSQGFSLANLIPQLSKQTGLRYMCKKLQRWKQEVTLGQLFDLIHFGLKCQSLFVETNCF